MSERYVSPRCIVFIGRAADVSQCLPLRDLRLASRVENTETHVSLFLVGARDGLVAFAP